MPADSGPAALSEQEIAERIRVLKRFRELLCAQRDRFRQYLAVLDQQKNVIEEGDTEKLEAQVGLEEKIVADIFSIQKVIDPLESMYRRFTPDTEISDLRSALDGLKTETARQADENRLLLSRRMTEVREEIKSLQGNPYTKRRSVYADSASPSLVDIQT